MKTEPNNLKGIVSSARDTELRRMMIAIRKEPPVLSPPERDLLNRLETEYKRPYLTAYEAAAIERIYARIKGTHHDRR